MIALKTGTWVGIKFTYQDGTVSHHGSWQIPHDSAYHSIQSAGESIGHSLIYEMAKQPTKTVVKAEIIDWDTRKEKDDPPHTPA